VKKYLVILLSAIILMTSCGLNSLIAGSSNKPNLTRSTYPRVDGSTATIPLSEAIAADILGMSAPEVQKFIKHNTTHNAYVNLINGAADIIFVTAPSAEELKMAKIQGVQLEVIPIVKEGFVFLVNTKNPINSLTTKQIQAIYQGKIKNWKEVGGEDKGIIAYQREANSGSQTLMEKTVMHNLPLVEAPKNVVDGMEGLIENIAKYDNSDRALGYSVFYYAKTMYNKDTIKFIAIDNIKPDNKSISTGKYPFSSDYYAVVKKSEPKDSPARLLLAWILSEHGQNLCEKAGYIPLKVR
jgi:phosphate transport system substrate-binding protein